MINFITKAIATKRWQVSTRDAIQAGLAAVWAAAGTQIIQIVYAWVASPTWTNGVDKAALIVTAKFAGVTFLGEFFRRLSGGNKVVITNVPKSVVEDVQQENVTLAAVKTDSLPQLNDALVTAQKEAQTILDNKNINQ